MENVERSLLPSVHRYPSFLHKIFEEKEEIQELFQISPIIGDTNRYVELSRWHAGVIANEKSCDILTYVADYDKNFVGSIHDPLLLLKKFWVKQGRILIKHLDCNGVRYPIPDEILKLLTSQNQSTGMTHVTYETQLQALAKFIVLKEPIKAINLTSQTNSMGRKEIVEVGCHYDVVISEEPRLFEFLCQLYVCSLKFSQGRWLLDDDVDDLVKLADIATKNQINPGWLALLLEMISDLDDLQDKGIPPIPLQALSLIYLEHSTVVFKATGSFYSALNVFRERFGISTAGVPDNLLDMAMVFCHGCNKKIEYTAPSYQFHKNKLCAGVTPENPINYYIPLPEASIGPYIAHYKTKHNVRDDNKLDKPLVGGEWHRIAVRFFIFIYINSIYRSFFLFQDTDIRASRGQNCGIKATIYVLRLQGPTRRSRISVSQIFRMSNSEVSVARFRTRGL